MSLDFSMLKAYRKKNGYTQDDIAEKLGVSRQAVAKWERGESVPDIESVVSLAGIYGVTVDLLIKNSQSSEKGQQYMFGLVKLNDKGQITLPVECRRVFDIEPGDLILVLGDTDKGIALVKMEGEDVKL
ncbi:MAG: helix-turn-helix domain-containing protein [Oscillospiraceae bacterium]|nr:helix-turn-helix domain-containing protein [Oscillospiraceae bacterium]MBQ2230625.1 helix-turn-helix domain-containing protein [Oscillospiraceae bacterium]MBQ3986783.1 helix-turn-helix domain-containing protein [Oscillospiraceae bacterium]